MPLHRLVSLRGHQHIKSLSPHARIRRFDSYDNPTLHRSHHVDTSLRRRTSNDPGGWCSATNIKCTATWADHVAEGASPDGLSSLFPRPTFHDCRYRGSTSKTGLCRLGSQDVQDRLTKICQRALDDTYATGSFSGCHFILLHFPRAIYVTVSTNRSEMYYHFIFCIYMYSYSTCYFGIHNSAPTSFPTFRVIFVLKRCSVQPFVVNLPITLFPDFPKRLHLQNLG